MYEFTFGGAWFKWSALDAPSKRLAAGSFATSLIAAVPLGLALGDHGYQAGYRFGRALSGRAPGLPPLQDTAAMPWMAWVTLAFGTLSALLWWRFSVRQDEMFNRIQNWALGMASAWTLVALLVWVVLAWAQVLPEPGSLGIAGTFALALYGFWFAAVRRWA